MNRPIWLTPDGIVTWHQLNPIALVNIPDTFMKFLKLKRQIKTWTWSCFCEFQRDGLKTYNLYFTRLCHNFNVENTFYFIFADTESIFLSKYCIFPKIPEANVVNRQIKTWTLPCVNSTVLSSSLTHFGRSLHKM